jgi:hypothetical protein
MLASAQTELKVRSVRNAVEGEIAKSGLVKNSAMTAVTADMNSSNEGYQR